MGSSGVLDLVLRVQTDEAKAKFDDLSSVIQNKLARQGLGALESMSDRVEQAFAQLEVEANQRSAAIQKAFSSLGVTSADAVKAQIQSIIAAFRQLKDNSGDLSSTDLANAQARMVSKLQAVAAAYRAQGAAATAGAQESTVAARSIEAAFGKLGITSGEQVKARIQELIQAYRTLRDSGTASVKDLDSAHASMVGKLQTVSSAYRAQGAAAKAGLGESELAAQAVDKALGLLGVKSAPQVKSRIQEIVQSYRTLRDSGTVSAKDLESAHASMVSKLQTVSGAYRNQGAAAKSGLGEAEQAARSVDKALSSLGMQGPASISKLNTSFSSFHSNITSVYVAITALSAAFATSKLIHIPAQFESISAQLKTVTKSSQGAQEAMGWVTEFAAKTPYELDQVSRAYAKLASYGFDPKAILEPIGNAASGMQKDLNDTVEAYADATRGEFERLKEFGINAETVGNQVTLHWMQNGQQMEKAVTKNATEISKALTGIWKDMFAGGMVDQMSTFPGRVSNLMDAITRDVQAFMGAGLFESIKGKISEITSVVEDLEKSGKLQEWGKTAAEGFDAMWEAGKRLLEMVKQFVEDYGAYIKILAAVGAYRVAAAAIVSLSGSLTRLTAALHGVQAAQAAASAGTAAVAGALTKAALGWVGLALAIPDAIDGYKNAALAAREYLSASSETNKANKMAADLQSLANENNKKAVSILNQVAQKYGLTVTSMEDWKKVLPEITRQMRDNGEAVGLTAEEYKAFQAQLQKAQAAGTAYLAQASDRYDYEIKAAQKLAETEGAAAANGLAAQRDKYRQILAVAQAVAETQIDLINRSAANETQKAELRKQVEKDLQSAKKSALEDWLSALKSGLDDALAQEKRYAQEAENAHKTTEEKIRDLKRQTMSDSEAYYDQVAAAREKLTKAEQAAATGTAEGYDKAVQLAKEAQGQFASAASAGKDVVGNSQAVQTAMAGVAAAGKVWEDAATAGKTAWADAATAFKQQILDAKAVLEDLKKNPVTAKLDLDITAVDAALNKLASTKTTSEHTVDPDIWNATKAIDELKKPTSSTHTVYVQKVEQYATGGPARGVPAMTMPGEYVVDRDAASRYLPLLHAINGLRLPQFAGGGDVFRPFASGLIPGVGDEDSEPVTLSEGAFVVRKAAVARYGTSILEAINSKRLPRFATGGLVLPDWWRRMREAQQAMAAPAVDSAPTSPADTSPLAIATVRPVAFRAMTTPLAARPGLSSKGTSALGRLDGLRQAASLRFASGGSLDETLADIALERKRTQEDYDADIADAQVNHDEELADLLAQEQEDLDNIAQELADSLADLQETWEDAQKQYASDLKDAKAALQDAQDALDDHYRTKYDAGNGWNSTTSAKDMNAINEGNPLNKAVTRHWQDPSVAGAKARAAWNDQYDDLAVAVEEARQQVQDVGDTYYAARDDFSTGTAEANDTAKSDTADTVAQFESDKADLEQELAKTLADLKKAFDRKMEDLAIEESRARVDAEDEGTYSISGFSAWLRDGGPVKALVRRFAAGGRVQAGLAKLFPGLPRFEAGGVAPMLPGAVAGADSILAALTPGEGVINLRAMGSIVSERALDALNRLDLDGFLSALPHYRDGGVAGLESAAKAAAAVGPSGGSGGDRLSAPINLQIGGRTYETRATEATAQALVKEFRRQGGNLR